MQPEASDSGSSYGSMTGWYRSLDILLVSINLVTTHPKHCWLGAAAARLGVSDDSFRPKTVHFSHRFSCHPYLTRSIRLHIHSLRNSTS